MKMILVLVLSCVLGVSADDLHEEIVVTGCTQTFAENMYGLDGEELFFADFEAGNIVDPQPDFMDHFSVRDAYQGAVGNREVCKHNLEITRKAFKDYKPERDPPSSPIVYPKDQLELGEKNSLVCHVTGFYPPPVTFFWSKNGENVTEGVTKNVPLLNTDGTFSQFSKLEVTTQEGDVYSCSVDHLTLEKPQTRMWEVKTVQPGVGPAVFCGLGLTVGLLGVAVGTFFLIKGNECS
ncbi:RLA class II histocompatibility antigen%2C DP alpha-1 chain-like [Xyrichtys novacula]|uniref:RLA class II histocompatibility antigen, DP alpha-1 chain-like n=1 Tax=Xyrichtys novacula TaxID=13765 RepID=A0AAV1EHZ6_XYRNO|nr:RLA class II histocompatibility antigen%2C DP alpha-1 chain-like [Xyrichtys novacula]